MQITIKQQYFHIFYKSKIYYNTIIIVWVVFLKNMKIDDATKLVGM